MSYLEANGRLLLTADALVFQPGIETEPVAGQYGILADDLKLLWQQGKGVEIAQLYELVIPGLILSKHIFRGLRRRLYCDESQDADQSKFVYSRTPAFDVVITTGSIPGDPKIVKRAAPPSKTFVVIVSPNIRHRREYPMIDGWLDRWNWVDVDPGLDEAPVNWLDRYDKKLYSRLEV